MTIDWEQGRKLGTYFISGSIIRRWPHCFTLHQTCLRSDDLIINWNIRFLTKKDFIITKVGFKNIEIKCYGPSDKMTDKLAPRFVSRTDLTKSIVE